MHILENASDRRRSYTAGHILVQDERQDSTRAMNNRDGRMTEGVILVNKESLGVYHWSASIG